MWTFAAVGVDGSFAQIVYFAKLRGRPIVDLYTLLCTAISYHDCRHSFIVEHFAGTVGG